MTPDELRARIGDLSVWSRGSERAPHKPLLLLWALGRLSRGEPRMVPYPQVDEGLRPLLEEFGPSRKSYHTEYPFWYLRNDGLWEVTGVEGARVREAKADQPTKSELVRLEAEGGLAGEAESLLRADPGLVREVAQLLLDAHFPDTLHDDILAAVGLELLETVRRRKRDPRFREEVLVAYGYRCAVCGFDARLGNTPLAIEAAHIRWHQARGPDTVTNGLGLCSLHHKLFDRGAFTVREDYRVEVSPRVNGGEAVGEMLVRFDGVEVGVPRVSKARPDQPYLEWHREQVYHR